MSKEKKEKIIKQIIDLLHNENITYEEYKNIIGMLDLEIKAQIKI